ncbi:MAG: TonB-dependent receptor [Bacteroidaceae bacterium]|nr:TonB-dependent receptor [Bacteroidaceae bacterium]
MKDFNSQTRQRVLALFVGLCLTVAAFAQHVFTVKGHVKDAMGELAGVNVFDKNDPSSGVITDINGDFTLKVPAPGTPITFSFVGYATQVIPATAVMNVTLVEDTKLLNDVLVIGYGTVKKSDATGAVTAIRPDEMSKGITTNAQDMLVGKIAGVSVISNDGTPGGGASIRIRGGSSLSSSNDPLYVIDGLPMDGSGVQGLSNPLSMVNPEDIETLTVLKDASATAIYGSRASNGVIIITTKKGRVGQKTKINYNGNMSLGHARKTYDVLSGDEFRDYVTNTLGQAGTGLGTANTDWTDEVLRTSVSHDHQIGITGALKNLPYRVGVGFTSNQGIIKTSKFDRFTASATLTPTFFDDHLNVTFNAKYMHAKNRYPDGGGAIGNALSIDPTQPVYDDTHPELGGYWQTAMPAAFNDPDWNYTTNTNTPQNPVALLDLRNKRANSDVLIGNLEFDYQIHGFEDLHIHANVAADYSEGRELTTVSPYSVSNNYFGWDGVDQSYKYNILGNIYANYVKDFADIHHLDAMVGVEQQHFNRKTYSFGQGNEWYDESGKRLDTPIANSPSLRSEQTHTKPRYSLLSYFGRFNYSLLDRYLLTFTMRFDGSSSLAPGHKWGKYPSVALAWKINEEKFLKDVEAIDEIKLRLGWGITGQQRIIYQGEEYNFYYLPRYIISDQYGQYAIGNVNYHTLRPEVFNRNLDWEKTTTWNIGLDWSLFNGKIDGSFEWYYRKTKDLISQVSVASGTNFGNYLIMNIGSLRNKGLEFNINAHPITTRDFSWTVSYNVAHNSNKITELTNGADFFLTGGDIGAGLSNKVQVNKVGYAANSFYVYQQVYDEAGNPMEGVFVDRNADGIINADDKYVYKKPDANVTMGLTNKFIYKNFDFSFTWRASFGNYLYYDFLSNRANVSWSGIYSNNAYTNTTKEAIRLGFQGKTDYYMSDYFIRNASFLRCDNITLGYSFKNLFSSGSYNGVNGRVYALVQNPFVITNYDGLDPERTHGTGVDGSVYPRPTTYQIGLSLNF